MFLGLPDQLHNVLVGTGSCAEPTHPDRRHRCCGVCGGMVDRQIGAVPEEGQSGCERTSKLSAWARATTTLWRSTAHNFAHCTQEKWQNGLPSGTLPCLAMLSEDKGDGHCFQQRETWILCARPTENLLSTLPAWFPVCVAWCASRRNHSFKCVQDAK